MSYKGRWTFSGLGVFSVVIKNTQNRVIQGTKRYFMLPKYSEFVIQ